MTKVYAMLSLHLSQLTKLVSWCKELRYSSGKSTNGWLKDTILLDFFTSVTGSVPHTLARLINTILPYNWQKIGFPAQNIQLWGDNSIQGLLFKSSHSQQSIIKYSTIIIYSRTSPKAGYTLCRNSQGRIGADIGSCLPGRQTIHIVPSWVTQNIPSIQQLPSHGLHKWGFICIYPDFTTPTDVFIAICSKESLFAACSHG